MNIARRGLRLALLASAMLLATSAAAAAEEPRETEAPETTGEEFEASATSTAAAAGAEREGQDGRAAQPEPDESADEPGGEPADVFLPSEAISEDAAVPFPADI